MNDHNSIKEELVNGIFNLLTNWWVWACLTVMVGFATGTITQQNILTILNKILAIFS